mgnify:CR=1 FL=1
MIVQKNPAIKTKALVNYKNLTKAFFKPKKTILLTVCQGLQHA